MIRLHHVLPKSDSMGGSRNAAKISIALRELEEQFEVIDHNRDKDLRPPGAPYRKLNPNGVTPTIEENGLVLWESSAILRYLADTRGRLIPGNLRMRAVAQQWLSWEAATFQPSFLAFYFAASSNVSRESQDAARGQYVSKVAILDGALGTTGGFVAGDFSIADIALGAITPIGFHLGIDLKPYRNVSRWLSSLAMRSAWMEEEAFRNDMEVGRRNGHV